MIIAVLEMEVDLYVRVASFDEWLYDALTSYGSDVIDIVSIFVGSGMDSASSVGVVRSY